MALAPCGSDNRRHSLNDRSTPESRQARNATLLRRLQHCSDPQRRLELRNALVTNNLPLARSIAARLPIPRHDGFEDMVQVASLGLIRAAEAFDPQREVSFSSFAVPYVRGALLHDLRDRQPAVRIPRPLWELRQKAEQVKQARRKQGLRPLDPPSLARLLGCGVERLLELETLGALAKPRSLDAPLGHGREGEERPTLLERLADPRSLEPAGAEAQGNASAGAEGDGREEAMRQALRAWMGGLNSQRRDLLLGRITLECTWVELGERLGIHPRMAQRRCDATLAELRQLAAAWETQAPALRTAAEPLPEPAPAVPPPGSAGR
ncbi:MAG: sigma-70 family RNA polymerase sigma factor [Cyanobium sp.]